MLAVLGSCLAVAELELITGCFLPEIRVSGRCTHTTSNVVWHVTLRNDTGIVFHTSC